MNKNTIIDTISIWTTAQKLKTSGRGRSASNQSLHGINKLRELILELAIHGKLVKQNPNDEPASTLLKKIAKQKAKMVKEGTIKKQNPLSEIGEDEKDFELPKGWEWIRLNNAIDVRDGTHDTPREASGPNTFALVTSKNFYNGSIKFDEAKRISEEDHLEISKRSLVERYDILFSMIGGNLGNQVMVNDECQFSIKNVALFKYYNKECTSPFFIKRFMEHLAINLQTQSSGGAQPFVALGFLRNLVIALPPIAEQRRIVAKVDELMALCDQLEQQQTDSNSAHEILVETLLDTLTNAPDQAELETAWQRISNHFDTLFTTEFSIDRLKQTILQLAVMGKLVPQNLDDEPANVLLKKIAKEKARLVKEGKIKAQKPLPKIDDSEKPFDLPKGWAWARFPEIGEFARGKSKHRPRNDNSLYSNGNYPMVQTGDVARAYRFVETFTALYNEKGLSQSRLWPKGTMCITIAANIADSSILGFDACFPDSIVGLIPSEEIGDARYFEYFVRTAKEHLMDFAPATAQKNINLGILETVFIPLPPAAEIKRIVAKVDELFAICDALKERINESQVTQLNLTDALVDGAVN